MNSQPSHLEGGATSAAPGQLLPRLGARLIDGILVTVAGIPLGLLLNFGPAWSLFQAALVYGYFVLLDVYHGTTLGKQLLGLQVRAPDGGRTTLQQAAIREAFTLVGAIPFLGPLLSLAAWIVIAVTINSSPTGQGKHDEFAGGTQVVRA